MWCAGRAEGLISQGWVWAGPVGAGLGRKGAGVLGLWRDWDPALGSAAWEVCCDWDPLSCSGRHLSGAKELGTLEFGSVPWMGVCVTRETWLSEYQCKSLHDQPVKWTVCLCVGKKKSSKTFWPLIFFVLNYFLEALTGVMVVYFWESSSSCRAFRLRAAEKWGTGLSTVQNQSSTRLDSVPRKHQGANRGPGVCVRTHRPAVEFCAAWTLISSSLQGWDFFIVAAVEIRVQYNWHLKELAKNFMWCPNDKLSCASLASASVITKL